MLEYVAQGPVEYGTRMAGVGRTHRVVGTKSPGYIRGSCAVVLHVVTFSTKQDERVTAAWLC